MCTVPSPKLAAVIVADIVGYSRLMGVDSAGTLTALRELRRDILAPLVAEYVGRAINDYSCNQDEFSHPLPVGPCLGY